VNVQRCIDYQVLSLTKYPKGNRNIWDSIPKIITGADHASTDGSAPDPHVSRSGIAGSDASSAAAAVVPVAVQFSA